MNPFFNEQNEIVRWYALMIDVDDRRKAEDALRESVEQLRAIIDTLPAFVWQATASGGLRYLNQQLLDYTGVSFEDHIRSGWSSVVHPDDAENALSQWRRSISTGEPYRVTKRHRRADGTYRWFEERANPMLDHARQIVCWYGIDFDIDDSKQTEDALRTERARLARALKVSAVGELSASIAHELNQPLAAVVANGHACLRWLTSEPPNLERARLTAQNIVRDGHSAAEVVSRIRALFKKAPPEKTELNLNDVIREALRLLDDEIRNNSVSIAEDLDKELPRVSADRVQMQQTLVNLLRNAIEAMEAVDQQARLLSLTSRTDQSNAVVIHVRDHGIGIDNVDRTFEPFFTTKANGLGLGLSICRSIVEAHGGRLWASANQGPGTTFSFTVPIANS
jgi:PAS domain S-box-containing protein